jgi:hypothetical protein
MKTKTQTLNPHQEHCLQNAAYFTGVRVCGRTRSRETFQTIEDARKYGQGFGDRRTMVYAITADGRDAHIENA